MFENALDLNKTNEAYAFFHLKKLFYINLETDLLKKKIKKLQLKRKEIENGNLLNKILNFDFLKIFFSILCLFMITEGFDHFLLLYL